VLFSSKVADVAPEDGLADVEGMRQWDRGGISNEGRRQPAVALMNRYWILRDDHARQDRQLVFFDWPAVL